MHSAFNPIANEAIFHFPSAFQLGKTSRTALSTISELAFLPSPPTETRREMTSH